MVYNVVNRVEENRLRDVLVLGVAFMLIFTSFNTMCNIEQTVITSLKADDSTFTGDGYISQCIIYAVFSLSNFFSPSFVAVLGTKTTMIAGAILYSAFPATFLYPQTWLLYVISAVLGVAAAALWTAQGSYLTLCSTKETLTTNSGIFWAMLQCSMFFGNTFVFWQFYGKTHIDAGTRTLVFSVLTAVGGLGAVSLLLLRKPKSREVEGAEKEVKKSNFGTALSAMMTSMRMITEKNMLLLIVTFMYSGLEISFINGVYSTSIGNTEHFGEGAKKLVGLCGILIGAGGVIGGTVFGLLGKRTLKYGRNPIIILGAILHTGAFIMVFLNLPSSSSAGPTSEPSYLPSPSAVLAMFCALIMGFGDSCFNTQIYSILGELYSKSEESASAFALFKFSQSALAAFAFFCSSQFTLVFQLGLLEIFCILGSLTFVMVERSIPKKDESPNKQSEESDEVDNEEELKLKPNSV